MPERLTVVFEDDALYRRLKVRAAEHGRPLKQLIEDAIQLYLGPEAAAPKVFNWGVFDRWQDEVEALNTGLADEHDDEGTPFVLKPIRYDANPPARRLALAEERGEYDAQ